MQEIQVGIITIVLIDILMVEVAILITIIIIISQQIISMRITIHHIKVSSFREIIEVIHLCDVIKVLGEITE